MMRRPARFAVEPFLALAVIAACGDSGGNASGPSPASATGITGATGLTSAGSGTTSDAPAGDSTAVPTTGEASVGGTTEGPPDGLPKLDVDSPLTSAGETTGIGPASAGCKKIDFLFVVDNSGSMDDEQANLIASFPGFIATITETLEAKDYHIMAVSTDDGKNTGMKSTCTNGTCNCTPAPVCCENACGLSGKTCNGFDCNNLPISQCHYEFGTGKEFDANGKHCMLADMKRYMTDSQPNLAETFECIANVGTYGSGDEKTMQALEAALSDAQNGAGGCDEGFLRDDAILVVTFITDEEDDMGDDGKGSTGDPASWYSAVVAAKNGDEKAAVILGLVGDSNLPMGMCAPGVDPNNDDMGAQDAPRLQSFVGMFPNGVIGSVCATDYTPFFQQAVGIIDLACDEFEPPG